ncbi:MAG: ABC transporter permease [Gammaproteobacteria bacterium]
MNPHTTYPASLKSLFLSLYQHRQLIKQMAWRDVIGRYKGSIMGLLWSFLTPILMLTVYTFVFSVVFKARWGGGDDESRFSFALVLFVGLIIHGLMAEVLNRAPNLILGNVNYVKKVIFPIEILPVVSFISAFFHAFISLIVLLIALLVINGSIHSTALLLPIILLPLAILILGIAWILASLGVYVRDIGLTIGILTTVMLFLSPVFFPISALPESQQSLLYLNPITFIIIQSREVLIWGNLPDWRGLLLYTMIALPILLVGYFWFQKTRKGFADVL